MNASSFIFFPFWLSRGRCCLWIGCPMTTTTPFFDCLGLLILKAIERTGGRSLARSARHPLSEWTRPNMEMKRPHLVALTFQSPSSGQWRRKGGMFHSSAADDELQSVTRNERYSPVLAGRNEWLVVVCRQLLRASLIAPCVTRPLTWRRAAVSSFIFASSRTRRKKRNKRNKRSPRGRRQTKPNEMISFQLLQLLQTLIRPSLLVVAVV